MKKIATLFFAAALILACNRAENARDFAFEGADAYAPAAESARVSKEKSEPVADRKLIKDGYIRFETDDLAKTRQHIDATLAQIKGAYISREDAGKGYNTDDRSVELRIPADKFDFFLVEISKHVRHFDNRNITVSDITEQYFDLDTRLKTKKELEARYLQLLQKATTVKDIIEIEKEIANLRSDIEVMEGRLRLMDNQVSLATLRIEFYSRQVEATKGFGFDIKRNFKNGWENFLSFFVGLISVWPFLIVVTIIAFWLRRRLRRKGK